MKADFTTAPTLAKAQGAKSWALRAAVDLAKLHREIGDGPVAREALEPVYASFTEGFATPDLVAAREVLNTL